MDQDEPDEMNGCVQKDSFQRVLYSWTDELETLLFNSTSFLFWNMTDIYLYSSIKANDELNWH